MNVYKCLYKDIQLTEQTFLLLDAPFYSVLDLSKNTSSNRRVHDSLLLTYPIPLVV